MYTRFWILLVSVLLLIAGLGLAQARETVYTVKRGDTLSGLAKRYGLSVSALASRNGLKPTAMLRIGDRLRIPAVNNSSSSASTPSELISEVASAIAKAPVKSGRWQRIVIHHSGTSQASIAGMIDHHSRVRHMEHGLAYHFVIGNGRGMGDGSIHVGNRWKKQLDGGHLASQSQNRTSLGICLVGNFDKTSPTSKQLASLTAVLKALQTRCKLGPKAIVTHQQINVVPTRCPGSRFPIKTVLRQLTESKK